MFILGDKMRWQRDHYARRKRQSMRKRGVREGTCDVRDHINERWVRILNVCEKEEY